LPFWITTFVKKREKKRREEKKRVKKILSVENDKYSLRHALIGAIF